MESLIAAQKKWERQNGLEKTIQDVQSVIDLITKAKEEVASESTEPLIALTRLKNPIKDSFERLNKDAKELHTSITNYGKLLDKRFKPFKVPQSSLDNSSIQSHLTNRAIGMHFLREGLFDVATTMAEEATGCYTGDLQVLAGFWRVDAAYNPNWINADYDEEMDDDVWADCTSGDLQTSFEKMYKILHSLRTQRDLEPAIIWANHNRFDLEHRGSNLEFELCRLRFIDLYRGTSRYVPDNSRDIPGPLRALQYARDTFPGFQGRYLKETASLLGALAYSPDVYSSPYSNTFSDTTAWDDVAESFTREYCGLLGLSEKSPLYTAVTAGGIALPVLEKLERVMGEIGGQWTSANELPVEIPLPPSYLFHSIFVCPVSKEQATDENPPMMMPCGHVICMESLEKISRGSKFKCPYCPNESHPRDAKKVLL